jgi:predicted GIY-YIG superfamily endonuclease
MTTTTLYRVYDNADRLIYVGISERVFDRLGQHTRDGWTVYAVKVTLQRYTDREAAAAAEGAAIRDEDPVWNLRGRPFERHMQWMIAYPDRHADDISREDLEEASRERNRALDALEAKARASLLRTGGAA